MEQTQQGSPASVTTQQPANVAESIVNKIVETQDGNKQPEELKTTEQTEDKSYSSKLQQLARQERKMREALEKERADMMAKVEAEKQAWIKEREQKDAPKKEKKNPIQTLMDEGWTYEQATQWVMEHGIPTADDRVKEVETRFEAYVRKQKELEDSKAKEAEESKRLEEERLKTEAESAMTKFMGEITAFLESNSEKYELTNLYGQSKEVYDVIDGYYQKTGKIMSKDEAAALVEAELEKLAEKALQAKKFASKITPKVDGTKDDKNAFSQRTISNAATSGATTTKPAFKTDEERIRNAMAILDGAK